MKSMRLNLGVRSEMDSIKRITKYGGGFLASALLAGKIFGPLIGQLQKIKTEEIITNER